MGGWVSGSPVDTQHKKQGEEEIRIFFWHWRSRKQRWQEQTEEEAGPLRLCWSELIHSICSQHLSRGPGLEGLAREDHARVEH